MKEHTLINAMQPNGILHHSISNSDIAINNKKYSLRCVTSIMSTFQEGRRLNV